jgi:hypothetical protein
MAAEKPEKLEGAKRENAQSRKETTVTRGGIGV